MEFKSFGFSDAGRVRSHNEDSYLANEGEKLFLLADGMGGLASGEVASKLAVEIAEKFVIRSRQKDITWPVKLRKDLSMEQNRLLAAVYLSNQKIQKTATKNPSMNGMGTTLIGGIIDDSDRLVVANVGDSRLYRIREGAITQITKDHTLVGENERKGRITKKQARNHPQKNVLTRALGYLDNNKEIDTFITKVRSRDIYLFCSDGLYSMLEDEEILTTIESIQDGSLYKIGISLILKANLSGGYDNITVILISFSELEEQ